MPGSYLLIDLYLQHHGILGVDSPIHLYLQPPVITVERNLVVIAEDQGDGDAFADRARWEANVRAGRSRAVSVTVQGWRHGGGELWAPNTIVTIEDDWLAAYGDMIVAGVKFTRSESGSLTELNLAMPSAFKLLPIAEAEEPGGW